MVVVIMVIIIISSNTGSISFKIMTTVKGANEVGAMSTSTSSYFALTTADPARQAVSSPQTETFIIPNLP
jgi:hypothetical protein